MSEYIYNHPAQTLLAMAFLFYMLFRTTKLLIAYMMHRQPKPIPAIIGAFALILATAALYQLSTAYQSQKAAHENNGPATDKEPGDETPGNA
jgi:hypothetical protein